MNPPYPLFRLPIRCKFVSAALLLSLLTACAAPLPSPTPSPFPPTATFTPQPTATTAPTATPRPSTTATPTPVPSATPTNAPTTIPTAEPSILSADEQFGAPLQGVLEAAGVTTIDCALPNAALWDALVKGGVMQQVRFLDRSLLTLLKRFTQADGTIKLPDTVTTFHCGFRQRGDGVMEPQWYLIATDGRTIFMMTDDGAKLIRGEVISGVPVPLLENGRPVEVKPPEAPPVQQVTPVPAQPTPVGGGQEPTSVFLGPTPTPKQERPQQGKWEQAGPTWFCNKARFDTGILDYAPQMEIVVTISDKATQEIFQNGATVDRTTFFSLYNTYVLEKKFTPLGMTFFQTGEPDDKSICNWPKVPSKLTKVWFFMVNNP